MAKHTHTQGPLNWLSVDTTLAGGHYILDPVYIIDLGGTKIAALWGKAGEKANAVSAAV